ncbi:hypothetical protein NPIL_600321 [Nephila pilipes]|uniref:Uncharacterized protein n=1 Tax=Nephila pilipes TaxID=299642 RepID=A0A8X6P276_NEPPI|nr:hypothetical protein NPIL_600321 [Nephila pilipes]
MAKNSSIGQSNGVTSETDANLFKNEEKSGNIWIGNLGKGDFTGTPTPNESRSLIFCSVFSSAIIWKVISKRNYKHRINGSASERHRRRTYLRSPLYYRIPLFR